MTAAVLHWKFCRDFNSEKNENQPIFDEVMCRAIKIGVYFLAYPV